MLLCHIVHVFLTVERLTFRWVYTGNGKHIVLDGLDVLFHHELIEAFLELIDLVFTVFDFLQHYRNILKLSLYGCWQQISIHLIAFVELDERRKEIVYKLHGFLDVEICG